MTQPLKVTPYKMPIHLRDKLEEIELIKAGIKRQLTENGDK